MCSEGKFTVQIMTCLHDAIYPEQLPRPARDKTLMNVCMIVPLPHLRRIPASVARISP